MVLKNIYIARHGYRANWLPLPHPPNPTGIDSDPPLAPHGVEQAKQLAGYLTSLPTQERPQFILTSPFYRCVETGKPIAEMLQLKIVLERGVGEWYKKGRSIIPAPANYDTLEQFFNGVLATEEFWHRDDTIGVVPDLSGETEEDIFARANLFWSKFIPIFEKRFPDISNILIISHAATKIALGLALLNLSGVRAYIDDDKDILRAGACSLDKFVRDGNKWNLIMNGNCEFLTHGEEMNWTFHSAFEAGSDEDIKARKALELKKLEAEKKQESIRETTPVTDVASGIDISSNVEYEDIYVSVTIPTIGKVQKYDESSSDTPRSKTNIIKPSAQFQISELGGTNPLIKLSNNSTSSGGHEASGNESLNNINIVDGKIYETSWKTLVGTDLIFDDYGELIGKVNEHLTCNENVKIEPKESGKVKEEDGTDEEMAESDEQSKGQDFQSNFLKKAIKIAKKKAATQL